MVFSLIRHLRLTVEDGLFFFSFLSEVPVPYTRRVVFFSSEVFVYFKLLSMNSWVRLACVLTNCLGLTFLFRVIRGFRSQSMVGVKSDQAKGENKQHSSANHSRPVKSRDRGL